MGIEWHFDLHLQQINEQVHAAIVPASMRAMEHVRGVVASQTPVDTGNLVGSEEVRPMADGAEIYIPGPYARNQHYTLDFHHTVGNALYLELPMMTEGQKAIDMLRDDLGKAM
jgi:hypothetical protein